MVNMIRLFSPRPATPRPPHDAGRNADLAEERVRFVPGVTVTWSYGAGPYFACARHCGEGQVASGSTLAEAFGRLESDLRSRNRSILCEAFRLL
jgi:hypothetical protein